ncbi:hypothetical protein LZ518_08470 [Sphingomonas sp. RB56-2]|uniref:Uncharacterized protein n=1 Tax=Sphingomonas brevis TaxID=2908206 RepID=A0ABT0S9Z9_9SPHN|nr:hypothetical protein [Sphingomonas brevis]MCL6741163.1 hypothetical protein [Sphingomonas brevis]
MTNEAQSATQLRRNLGIIGKAVTGTFGATMFAWNAAVLWGDLYGKPKWWSGFYAAHGWMLTAWTRLAVGSFVAMAAALFLYDTAFSDRSG